jgi:hypothetical protein
MEHLTLHSHAGTRQCDNSSTTLTLASLQTLFGFVVTGMIVLSQKQQGVRYEMVF